MSLDAPRSSAPGTSTKLSQSMAPQKDVTLVEEPEEIGPTSGAQDDNRSSPTLVGSSSPKLHRAGISGKKMTGRPSTINSASSNSLTQQFSTLTGDNAQPTEDNKEDSSTDPKNLLSQVVEWLNEEKAKTYSRHLSRHHHHLHHQHQDQHHHHNNHLGKPNSEAPDESTKRESSPDPQSNDFDFALHKLEKILAAFTTSNLRMVPKLTHRQSSTLLRKGSIAKKFKRGSIATASSDTEFFGDDILVPNVEADLDNSKTFAFTGGEANEDTSEGAKRRDHDQWVTFKQDIVRLTHTLKLKGWRRIPIEQGAEIDVARLCGALTNAVYVVKPPKDIPDPSSDPNLKPVTTKRQPMQLLLRIYGPQVGHLIDRDTELAILRRLARKRIGPSLLGTFTNGRFEEFLHATTLSAEDLRIPETSKQIAKRMRELHDGIDLLEAELDAGPAVFVKWDKWVDRCEKVITFLDTQVHEQEHSEASNIPTRYTKQGFVCGVEWPVFRKALDTYRKLLVKKSGGFKAVKDQLVFAHNDTQYGNLMRLQPLQESPLLQPSNQHKQLVVIDFEYASQNPRGMEFANHFTEWCYDYHHPELSHICNTNAYPTYAEQYRFIRSYVMHRPQFNPTASATPKMEAREKTNISDFMLDARTPQGAGSIDYEAEERAREKAMEEDIQRLIHETRLWRMANSAQWVAWGIVQAKVPEVDDESPSKKSLTGTVIEKVKGKIHPMSDPLDAEEKQLQEDAKNDRPEGREQEEAHADGEEVEQQDEEFDCLAYAHDRAMFFWGDALQMGIIKEEELPEKTRKQVKILKY